MGSVSELGGGGAGEKNISLKGIFKERVDSSTNLQLHIRIEKTIVMGEFRLTPL